MKPAVTTVGLGIALVLVVPGAFGGPAAADVEAVDEPEAGGPSESADVHAKGTVLFDGGSLDGWQTFGFSGGEFDRHARLSGQALRFSIPDGQGWAKTGLRTRDAVVTMPARGAGSARAIGVRMDAARSNVKWSTSSGHSSKPHW